MGPPLAGFIDGGSMGASFVGDKTQTIDSTVSTATWTFPDGQTEARLGTEASEVYKEFTGASPGGSYFSLAVTDSAGASSISRRLIYTFNDRTGPARVMLTNITGGLTVPPRATVKVVSGGNTDQFPDGAEVLIFEEASYGATAGSIGGNFPFRNNIVFRGWIVEDTTTVNPFSSDVTFKVEGLPGLLGRTHAKDLFLAYANPPTGTSEWIEAENLSMDRAAVVWGKHRSTVMEITDFALASGLPMWGKIAFQDLSKGTLWSQITQNYGQKGVNGYVAADLQGNLYAMQDAQISGGSDSLPLTMHIEKQDRRDVVQILHPHYDKNALVELYSVASTAYIGARSPGGDAHGYWGGTKVHQKGLVTGETAACAQHMLTQWSGNMRAKINSKYPRVVAPISGYLKTDPVPQSRITLSLSAADNVRGIDWNDKQFFQTKVTHTYNSVAATPLTTVELEEVVNGSGGSSITFEKIIPPPPMPPPPIPPPPPPPPTQGDGFGTAFVFLSNKLARTLSLGATSPTWTDITGGITGISYDFIIDPWNPLTRAFALTSDGVFKITNIKGGTPTVTQVLSVADANTLVGTSCSFFYKMQASINSENYIVTFVKRDFGSNDDRLYCFYSNDAGTTWNASVVADSTFVADNRIRLGAGFDIVPHTVGGNLTLYAVYEYYRLASTQVWRTSRSQDGGATWSVQSNISCTDTTGGVCVNTPYDGNTDGQTVWVSLEDDVASNKKLFRKSTDGGTSYSQIDIGGRTGTNSGTRAQRLGIEIFVGNGNQVALWTANNELWKSTDGSTFSQVTYTGYVPGTHGSISGGGGFPSKSGQYYLVTDGRFVFVSTNGGTTWIDKTGNLKTIITSDDPGVASMEKGVIVPIWVTE
jgi:hypothetical protein